MQPLRLVVPKGRIQEGVAKLLAEAGYGLRIDARSYRPACEAPDVQVKLLKAQNIASLTALGAHDAGFTGHDWVVETGADVVELFDTGLDPVRVVAAAPVGIDLAKLGRPVVVASEYEQLARRFCTERGLAHVYVRTYGATEVFPPEDADLIVDNTASGTTLAANDLTIVGEVLRSTTRFVASHAALAHPDKGPRLRELTVLMESILRARGRVLLEMNVATDRLEAVTALLPAMKTPTVQPLHGGGGFAVKAAVRRDEVNRLIPRLHEAGASDILQYAIEKVVP